jgi:hypothetical protein
VFFFFFFYFLTQKEGMKQIKKAERGQTILPPTFLPQPLESNKDVI